MNTGRTKRLVSMKPGRGDVSPAEKVEVSVCSESAHSDSDIVLRLIRVCSVCGRTAGSGETEKCPACGAAKKLFRKVYA